LSTLSIWDFVGVGRQLKKLRVIFQGGGAKLATLLAAAHALDDICKTEGYTIVEYGGVSAGSIAAATMALPIKQPASHIRKRLITNSADFDRKVRRVLGCGRGFNMARSEDTSGYGARHFTRDVLTLRILWLPVSRLSRIVYYAVKVLFGASLVSEKTLISTLTKVFSDESEKPYLLSDTKNLTVFTSLLERGKSKTYPSEDLQGRFELQADWEADKNKPLGLVLAKSSSMPLVFSGHKVMGAEVDGGICGNLPASYFIDANADDVKTLVFVFPQEDREIKGLASFLSALISSAMESTVREARIQTTESGGVVCELPVYVETFDFPKALSDELSDDRFHRVSHDLKPLIQKSLAQLFGVGRYKVLRTTKYSKDEVSDIFDDLYRRYPIRKTEGTKIMVDRSARRGLSSTFDERCYIDLFEPVKDKLEVCQIGLPFNLTSDLRPEDIHGKPEHGIPLMRNLFIDVTDAEGVSVDIVAYLALSVRDGSPWNRILIFIKGDVKAYPIEVVTRFDGEVFGDYRSRGWDFFSSYVTLGTSCKRHRWICVLHDDGEFTTTDLNSLSDERKEEIVPYARSLTERFKLWSEGRQGADDDVDRLIKKYCRESIEPNQEKKVVSWEVEDLDEGYSAGFRFDRKGTSGKAEN
tara:strand:- start:3479 stop:5401 length:1923 start_codon:yes stop_codon:yes gene_type:complete